MVYYWDTFWYNLLSSLAGSKKRDSSDILMLYHQYKRYTKFSYRQEE